MTFAISRKALLAVGGVLAVVLAGMVGGCGGETTTTAVGETAKAGSCVEEGISTPARKEGTCVDGGTRYVVVNRDGVLKLPDLEAKLLDIREAKTISGESGESATAEEGTYAIVELSITNRTDEPAKFEGSQILIWVGGGPYREDLKGKSQIEKKSFLWQDTPIQPQDSQVGTVVFDVPSSVLKSLDEDGNVDIANFGSKGDVLAQDEIGTIRTYQ